MGVGHVSSPPGTPVREGLLGECLLHQVEPVEYDGGPAHQDEAEDVPVEAAEPAEPGGQVGAQPGQGPDQGQPDPRARRVVGAGGQGPPPPQQQQQQQQQQRQQDGRGHCRIFDRCYLR